MASNGSLHSRLRAAGLIGNKHVPAAYLRASASQRLALLQGLMDTDGGCERRGSYVSFTNCNRRLADAVAELAVSLGMKVRRDDRPAMLDNVARGTAYRVSFTPTVPVFRLTRKAAGLRFDGAQQLRRHHRMIVAAEPIERPGFMRCISVDSPHRMYLCGEGMIPTHNTRTGAEWVRHQVESGACRRIALVAPTSADVRDMMVEGESGILAISPPWFMPRYEPARRRLTWPNGARATTFSADEPDRLRVAQLEAAWCDEVAAWRYPAAFDNLLLGLRLGDDPRLCVTTTPRPVRLVVDLIDDPRTAITGGTTYDNRSHLAASFFERIVTRYEGTRLGRQELLAEVLEVSDGLWFRRFDAARHVALAAEYDDRIPVHLAIDCGVSRHTAAVWFQVRPSCHLSVASCQQDLSSTGNWQLTTGNSAVTVFGDFYAEGLYAEAAAGAIRARGEELPCRGRADTLRLDPAFDGPDRDRPDGLRRVRAGLRTAIAGPLAQAPRPRRPGTDRGPAGQGPAADPPAVHRADGGVPELHPATDRQRRPAGRAGRPAAPARGPDGRPAGRRPRPLPRGPDRTAAVAAHPRESGRIVTESFVVESLVEPIRLGAWAGGPGRPHPSSWSRIAGPYPPRVQRRGNIEGGKQWIVTARPATAATTCNVR